MLTIREHRTALVAGGIALGFILLFAVVATLSLLSIASGQTVALDAYLLGIFTFTLWQAGLSTLLSVVFGVAVAIALSRRQHFFGRIWLIRLLAVPMGLPTLVAAFALIDIWGNNGLINDALRHLGLTQPIRIYGLPGILLAHVFFNLPLAARLTLNALDRVPGEYWRTAASLNMGPVASFRFIEAPVISAILPGIAGLIFMLCATSFTLVLTLGGGPQATTLEVAIYQALRFDFDPQRAILLSGLQIALSATVLLILSRLPKPEEEQRSTGAQIRRFDGSGLSVRLFDSLVLGAVALFTLSPLLQLLLSAADTNFAHLLADPLFIKALITSLLLALGAAILCLCLAIAIILCRLAARQGRAHNTAETLLATASGSVSSLVLLLPPIVLATGWFLVLRQIADVNHFTPLLVIIINALMALPFAMRSLEPAIATHWSRNGRLSASLGLSGWSRYRIVDWPGLRKTALMAACFAMALSLGDLGTVALFGGDSLVTLPWLLFARMGSYRMTDAAGLAAVLAVLCLTLSILGTGKQQEKGPQ